jgi:hypothetical protein
MIETDEKPVVVFTVIREYLPCDHQLQVKHVVVLISLSLRHSTVEVTMRATP